MLRSPLPSPPLPSSRSLCLQLLTPLSPSFSLFLPLSPFQPHLPPGGLFTGAEGPVGGKTAEERRKFGGIMNAPYDTCYHQVLAGAHLLGCCTQRIKQGTEGKHRQIDRHTDRQTDTDTHTQPDRQPDRQTHTHRHTHTQTRTFALSCTWTRVCARTACSTHMKTHRSPFFQGL